MQDTVDGMPTKHHGDRESTDPPASHDDVHAGSALGGPFQQGRYTVRVHRLS